MAFDLGRLLPLAGSLVISTFTIGTALAQDAVTTGAVNLRAGPGTQFPRVTTLPAGAGVDITSCNGAWCRVVYRGMTGFVSRNLLDEDSVVVAPPRRIYVEPPVYVRPRVYVEPPFYADPPFYPSYRPGWRPPYRYGRPGFGPRPGWNGGGRPGWSGGGGRPGPGPGWSDGGGRPGPGPGWSGGGGRPGPGPGWSGGGGGRPGPGPGWSGGGGRPGPGPGMGGGGGRPPGPGPGMGGGGGRPPVAQPPGERPPGMVPGFTGARPDRS